MMYANRPIKWRNELKFICTKDMRTILKHRISSVLQLDRHAGETDGSYRVSSLYFDDWQNSCCHDNNLGIGSRSKYRIRMYNKNYEFLRLEQKLKSNGKCAKRSCRITIKQYKQLCRGDVSSFIQKETHPVLKSFALKIQLNGFTPKILVDYKRVAFVDYAGNVRVTFDDQCGFIPVTDLFLIDKGPRIPFQENGLSIMELKFDEFVPDYIRQILQLNLLRQTTFSKYYISRLSAQNHSI